GQPDETTARTQVIAPDGTLYEAQSSYTGPEAFGRMYAQNRFTVGLATSALSLFTGNPQWNFRFNMPIDTVQIQKDQISTEDDVEKIVLSIWDNANGNEVLNDEGYAAIARSLHTGLITADSPALENIYITYETRKKVAEKLMA